MRVRAMAYLGAIALLGCTSCGDVEPPQDGAADRALTTTPVIASHVPIADLTKFSETVAQAPRWAVARRGGPTPFASQLAETTGAVRGTVVGLRAGPPTQSSPEDALGIEDPTGSGTTLMLQDAHLMVEVSDTFGPGAALFGLDYLIQTHADDHYNVDTLDELAAVAAGRA